MKYIYTVDDVKQILAEAHDNVSSLITLADYCEAVVEGYNKFREKNNLEENDNNDFAGNFEVLRDGALSIYEEIEDKVLDIRTVDGYVGQINSSPIGNANKSITNNLAYSESGADLMQSVSEAEGVINSMVDSILSKVEFASDIKAVNPDEVVSCINNILSLTRDGLKGLGDCAKKIQTVEQKYFEK